MDGLVGVHRGRAQVRKQRKDRRGPHILSMSNSGDWVSRAISESNATCTCAHSDGLLGKPVTFSWPQLLSLILPPVCTILLLRYSARDKGTF